MLYQLVKVTCIINFVVNIFACVILLKFCTFTRCNASVKMSINAQNHRDLACIIRILALVTIQLLNCISGPSNFLFTVNRSSSCHRQNYGQTVVLMSNTWCMRARQDILASRFTTFWFDGSKLLFYHSSWIINQWSLFQRVEMFSKWSNVSPFCFCIRQLPLSKVSYIVLKV